MIPKSVVIGIVSILVGLYYEQIGDWLSRFRRELQDRYGTEQVPKTVMLEEELVKYKHLGILGHVFDVSSAPKFYGEEGHYNFFTGVDGTRAFASSDLSGKSFIPTVDGLAAGAIKDAFDWLTEFKAKYPLVGVIRGLYFDEKGRATAHYNDLKKSVEDYMKRKANDAALYPHCNIASHATKSEVDCVQGYKEARYPRLMITPSRRDPRCVCLTQNYLNAGKTRLYPNCKEFDRVCKFSHKDLDRLLKNFQN